jgi:hypothetical protein
VGVSIQMVISRPEKELPFLERRVQTGQAGHWHLFKRSDCPEIWHKGRDYMSLMTAKKDLCDCDLLLRYSKIMSEEGKNYIFETPKSCKRLPV